MKQPITTSYGTYPNRMEVSVPLPSRTAANEPFTPDSRQQFFDESAYFSTGPQGIMSFPVTTVAEGSIDPWFMDIPGTASPQSSRLSMSPSQGVATPSSDDIYSPPYPEQLQLPAYHFLEQPQPVRSCSTSHPNWVSNGENWERNYAENELWSAQPYVAQLWFPNTYDGFAPQQIATSHASASDGTPSNYISHFPQPQVVQTMAGTGNGNPLSGAEVREEEVTEEEDSSDEESDWAEEASDYSQSRSQPRTRSSRPHVEKWSVPVPTIQQSDIRAHKCNISGCPTSFVRPEHLRRHIRSKHMVERHHKCKIEGCRTESFSRGDNLRDHYWTHLNRGGRMGKNKKFTLQELKEVLGPKEKKLIRRLREKLRQHEAKEKFKRQRVARPPYVERSKL